MIPLHYVAGKDCDGLFEAICALYDKYPGMTIDLVSGGILILFIVIFLIYRLFNPLWWETRYREDDD